MTGIATDLQRNDLQATDLQKKDLQANSAQPTSFDNYLEPVLRRREPRVIAYGEKLLDFRNWVTNEVDAQANYTDRYAPAALETYDRDGGIANRVVLNPWYETQHQEAYRRGIIALPYTDGAPHLVSFIMGYLLSQADISLHCPVTLTGAVAFLLAHRASESLRRKYLPDLIRADGHTTTGGTWATEKHGGSDIGATTTIARPQNGDFSLHGLKWFASNANSGLAVATARPEGAEAGLKGLGLYLVPSQLPDGTPNHYLVRRLKEKLGTRGLPTGEIELLGAEAAELAPPPEGFRLMMDALEYSRIHNAVGAVGVQRRSLQEALNWCRARQAFGHNLIDFPMVLDELLGLRVRFEASALLAFEAAVTFDACLSDSDQHIWLRFVTALAKYLTAEDAIRGARAALELIGGNGYTADYPMARILRDAQVLSVWEGPANIQALELMRLLLAHDARSFWENRIRTILGTMPDALSDLRQLLSARFNKDCEALNFATSTAPNRERYARKLLHRLGQSLSFALMCEVAAAHHQGGDSRATLNAFGYHEDIQPAELGAQNPLARDTILHLLDD